MKMNGKHLNNSKRGISENMKQKYIRKWKGNDKEHVRCVA